MKLIYVANTRIPTEKAHGWAIMKMCESFAHAGVEVELILPRRQNRAFESIDPFEHYGVKKNFTLVFLNCPDLISITGRLPRLGASLCGVVQNWLYARVVRAYVTHQQDAVIFSREHRLLYLLRTLPNKLVYEIHDFPENHTGLYQKLFERLNKIVVTNQLKKDTLQKIFKVEPAKILIASNAIDTDIMRSTMSKSEARQKIGLITPQNKKIALYAGGFQRWKGVYVLGEALQYLPKDIEVYFVGGGAEPDRSNFVSWLQEHAPQNYIVHGAVPHYEIAAWLQAADVLVAPGTAKDNNAARYTSPLKLLEYFAVNRPVIMTDLPAIKDLLRSTFGFFTQDNTDYHMDNFFAPPDDPQALARAITACARGEHDWRAVHGRFVSVPLSAWPTWENRAQRILGFIQS